MHTTWDVPPSLWATVEFIPEEFTDIYLALVQKLKFSTRGFSCTTLSLIKTTVYCIKLNITQLSFPEKISDYKILVSKHKFLLSSIKNIYERVGYPTMTYKSMKKKVSCLIDEHKKVLQSESKS